VYITVHNKFCFYALSNNCYMSRLSHIIEFYQTRAASFIV